MYHNLSWCFGNGIHNRCRRDGAEGGLERYGGPKGAFQRGLGSEPVERVQGGW